MKKNILILFLTLMAFTAYGQGIHFEKGSFKEALEKAGKEDKILFIDVYAVWCGPCKLMSRTVFTDAEVGRYMDSHFIALKIDSERGEGPSVKTRYAVEGLPGYLFLDPAGNLLYRSKGRMSKEKFMELLEAVRKSYAEPDNVAALAARYEREKGNEAFLRTYLDKLKETKAAGYGDIVEQYLKIQESMADTSREMVLFLYNHSRALVFGGEADRIVRDNFGGEAWDLYARKKIRETFQKLPEQMARNTTEAAILKRDTSYIDLSIRRAREEGLDPAPDQRNLLMIYYYKQTGNGEMYKKAAAPEIERYMAGMDVQKLQKGHAQFLKEMKDTNRRGRSFAQRDCEKLRYLIAEYSRFMTTDADRAQVDRWVSFVMEVLPDEPRNQPFHARHLYMKGERERGIRLLETAMAANEEIRHDDNNIKDLESMKAGKEIMLR